MGWDLLGHERTVELLAASLRDDRAAQSLLLSGPRQVGKRRLALALAAAANCDGPRPPCGVCRACRLGASYPDLHLLELREGRQRIGIREVQELQGELARRPAEGRWRIAIVADAERLSSEAENCLLKTLEEPPPAVLLILTVEEAEALLPTTVSRCRQLRLRPVATEAIAAWLAEHHQLDADQAAVLAELAEGRPGWAIAAANDPARLASYRAARERLVSALDAGRLARLETARGLAEQWSGKSELVRDELRIWTRWWQALLRLKLGLDSSGRPADSGLAGWSDRFSLDQVRGALSTLLRAREDLDANVNARLALDLALLNLPRPAAG